MKNSTRPLASEDWTMGEVNITYAVTIGPKNNIGIHVPTPKRLSAHFKAKNQYHICGKIKGTNLVHLIIKAIFRRCCSSSSRFIRGGLQTSLSELPLELKLSGKHYRYNLTYWNEIKHRSSKRIEIAPEASFGS